MYFFLKRMQNFHIWEKKIKWFQSWDSYFWTIYAWKTEIAALQFNSAAGWLLAWLKQQQRITCVAGSWPAVRLSESEVDKSLLQTTRPPLWYKEWRQICAQEQNDHANSSKIHSTSLVLHHRVCLTLSNPEAETAIERGKERKWERERKRGGVGGGGGGGVIRANKSHL